MFEKEIVKAKKDSVAINAKGNVTYNDFGELLPALKELLTNNLEQNPIMLEKKIENLEKYMEFLEKNIKLNGKRIDLVEVSKEPDSMELLLGSMKKASLKGEKIDQATLSSAVITRLGTESNFTQLIYEKAYEVLGK